MNTFIYSEKIIISKKALLEGPEIIKFYLIFPSFPNNKTKFISILTQLFSLPLFNLIEVSPHFI